MPNSLIEIRGLSVGYGNIQVLRGIDLAIEFGERIGIFGPNGHGKTTLLETISGLITPWEGEILLKGQRIDSWSPRQILEAGVVHVCQGNTLFPRMTVLENLYCGAYSRRVWKDRRRSIKQVFQLFPRLAERRGQKACTLSGGERQMLAIGAGIMAGGEVLMLDEPTLGLSPAVRGELSQAIQEAARGGIAIVLVEQDFDFLSEIVSRFCMVEEGRIVFEGKPEQISGNQVLEMYFGGAAGSPGGCRETD
jgi:branched-chain amino acid transport system ATP-binding protein